MFSKPTVDAILALACCDKTATRTDKDRLQSALVGKNYSIVRYKDAANRLQVGVWFVKKLVSNGLLDKVTSGGERGYAVTEDSLNRFINQGQ